MLFPPHLKIAHGLEKNYLLCKLVEFLSGRRNNNEEGVCEVQEPLAERAFCF